MSARPIVALIMAIAIGLGATGAKAETERAHIDRLIAHYAAFYEVPAELVHRVVMRESTYNPRARNGPYWGLMQILPATARTMGFRGKPEDLLDPEINLIYAVRYLRGAYITAGGDQDRAVRHYAAGYYYHARDKGLLEVTGLRAGANPAPTASPVTPVAPQPAPETAVVVVEQTPEPPSRFEAPVVASITPQASEPIIAEPQAPIAVALGFAPPTRPATLDIVPVAEAGATALDAISLAAAPAPDPSEGTTDGLGISIEAASAFFSANGSGLARIEGNIFETTFSMLDGLDAAISQSMLGAGDVGFLPPARPDPLLAAQAGD